MSDQLGLFDAAPSVTGLTVKSQARPRTPMSAEPSATPRPRGRPPEPPAERYGSWTVLEEVERASRGRSVRVRCSCGREAVRLLQSLRHGCIRCEECSRLARNSDSTLYAEAKGAVGQRIGGWTVVGVEASRTGTRVYVRCTCGREASRSYRDLRVKQGECGSCGGSRRAAAALAAERAKCPVPKWLYRRVQDGASDRGPRGKTIPFDLTHDDLLEIWTGVCALSGIPLRIGTSKGRSSETTASVDRIDSAKPYTRGNVQWVHKSVNLMKQTLGQDDFIEWCKRVAVNHE